MRASVKENSLILPESTSMMSTRPWPPRTWFPGAAPLPAVRLVVGHLIAACDVALMRVLTIACLWLQSPPPPPSDRVLPEPEPPPAP